MTVNDALWAPGASRRWWKFDHMALQV